MISIVTATYNAAAGLPRLMASLIAQSDHNFEWIVADGGSTDGTVALLQQAGPVLSRWVSEPDNGIYDALNKALALARGEYYLVVGADDDLEPRAVEVLRAAAARSADDVISGCVRIGASIVPPRRYWATLRSGPPFVSAHSVGSLIRRSLHEEIGWYSRRYPIAADTLFLLQVAERGKRFAYVPDILGRFGVEGISSGDTLGALCESFRAHVEVRGRLVQNALLLLVRLLRNSRRIKAQRLRRNKVPS